MNTEFSERMLWSRILSEADEASAEDAFLVPIFSGCITRQEDLSNAITNRIANLLAPPFFASTLPTPLRALLDLDPRILAPAAFDMAAVLERDPATRKPLRVLFHAKGFLADSSAIKCSLVCIPAIA